MYVFFLDVNTRLSPSVFVLNMKKKIVIIGLLGPESFPASSITRMTREEKSKRYGSWLFQSL